MSPSRQAAGQDAKPPTVMIFGHIPKTAGSTFKTILWRQYSPKRVFFSMVPDEHPARFAALRDDLAAARSARKPPVDVVVTHAGYGVHAHLADGYHYPYVTFLREPIDRVISGYYMFLRQGKVPKGTSLETFVAQWGKPGWNMQTSFLSGYFLECHMAGRLPERDAFDEGMLARAKANLQRHAVVGLTERFDESMMFFNEVFGWPLHKMRYYRTNVGKNRKPPRQFDPATLAVVEQYNQLDVELYAFAKQLFEERLAARREVIEAQLERFRTLNRLYGATVPRLLPVARPFVHGWRRLMGS